MLTSPPAMAALRASWSRSPGSARSLPSRSCPTIRISWSRRPLRPALSRRTLADVLLRRTRLGLLAARELLDAPRSGAPEEDGESRGEPRTARRGRLGLRRRQHGSGRAALGGLALAVGSELAWSRRRREQEVEAFYAEAAAEGLLAEER